MASQHFSRRGKPRRSRRKSAPKTAKKVALPEPARQHLQSLLRTLEDMESTVILAVEALHREQGFIGICAAQVLRLYVSDRLCGEIERATEAFSLPRTTDLELV